MSSKLADHAKALGELNQSKVDVGWFANARYPEGQSVAAVMIANEFGTKKIPARPLLRQSAAVIDEKLPGWIGRRTVEVLDGKLGAQEYKEKMGEALVATVMDTLKTGDFEPNSEITIHGTPPDKDGNQFIKGKGFDRPLVGITGLLGQSLTHRNS